MPLGWRARIILKCMSDRQVAMPTHELLVVTAKYALQTEYKTIKGAQDFLDDPSRRMDTWRSGHFRAIQGLRDKNIVTRIESGVYRLSYDLKALSELAPDKFVMELIGGLQMERAKQRRHLGRKEQRILRVLFYSLHDRDIQEILDETAELTVQEESEATKMAQDWLLNPVTGDDRQKHPWRTQMYRAVTRMCEKEVIKRTGRGTYLFNAECELRHFGIDVDEL